MVEIWRRLFRIQRVVIRYRLDDLLFALPGAGVEKTAQTCNPARGLRAYL